MQNSGPPHVFVLCGCLNSRSRDNVHPAPTCWEGRGRLHCLATACDVFLRFFHLESFSSASNIKWYVLPDLQPSSTCSSFMRSSILKKMANHTKKMFNKAPQKEGLSLSPGSLEHKSAVGKTIRRRLLRFQH